jgi:LemA protein
VLVLVVLAIVYAIVAYNMMIGSRNMVDQGWSGIDVQLKRRHDLIPNLVESVKAYAAHERDAFQAVTDARARAVAASGPAAAGAAERALDQAMGRLFAVAEAYPQRRATENYRELQEELANTEDQISAARRIYNGESSSKSPTPPTASRSRSTSLLPSRPADVAAPPRHRSRGRA